MSDVVLVIRRSTHNLALWRLFSQLTNPRQHVILRRVFRLLRNSTFLICYRNVFVKLFCRSDSYIIYSLTQPSNRFTAEFSCVLFMRRLLYATWCIRLRTSDALVLNADCPLLASYDLLSVFKKTVGSSCWDSVTVLHRKSDRSHQTFHVNAFWQFPPVRSVTCKLLYGTSQLIWTS